MKSSTKIGLILGVMVSGFIYYGTSLSDHLPAVPVVPPPPTVALVSSIFDSTDLEAEERDAHEPTPIPATTQATFTSTGNLVPSLVRLSEVRPNSVRLESDNVARLSLRGSGLTFVRTVFFDNERVPHVLINDDLVQFEISGPKPSGIYNVSALGADNKTQLLEGALFLISN